MKQSELNHLRRLLGWVSCEIGQTPEEMYATLKAIGQKIDGPGSAEGQRRLVEAYDKSSKVPKYVRQAVKALRPLVGGLGEVVDVEPIDAPPLFQIKETP